MSERLYALLSEHLTERKRALFDRVAAHRTRHVTVVLEDIYQAQNANAIFRSMESWGLQDVYAIENEHSLNLHRRIAKGAYDWITLHRYADHAHNTVQCMDDLHRRGYRIFGTTLTDDAVTPAEVDLHNPVAVVMGTELTGISEAARARCDGFIRIPMVGFTESLNVSVAAGVILQRLTERLRASDVHWQLSEEEQLALKIAWARKSIHWSQYLVDMYESGELK